MEKGQIGNAGIPPQIDKMETVSRVGVANKPLWLKDSRPLWVNQDCLFYWKMTLTSATWAYHEIANYIQPNIHNKNQQMMGLSLIGDAPPRLKIH